MTQKTYRWGLLGAGEILERWLKGFRQVEHAEIAAVASRRPETARKQAERYGIAEALSYDELIQRRDIDVMYIPVPHTAHKALAMRAMEAGHNVLVEKPAAVTAADWDDMVDCAKANRVFLMEAVWTRCFPAIDLMLQRIAAGEIGEIQNVQASFTGVLPQSYEGRLTDPEQAGGVLLDIGVYGLHFARMVYGKSPVRLTSVASLGAGANRAGIDEQGVYVGLYDDGAMSVIISSMRSDWPDTAMVNGTKGYIRVPEFWRPTELEIVCGKERSMLTAPVPQSVPGISDEGYQFEIRHVQDCLARGLSESPLVTHAATREILAQCDELRAQWGLRYPFERR